MTNTMYMIEAEAVGDGRASLLPDHTIHPGSFLVEQALSAHMDSNVSSGELRAAYQGALAVLNILGSNPIATPEETAELARKLIHECKYFLQ